MRSDEELERECAKSEAQLHALSPSDCIATAALVREMKPIVKPGRQREMLEEAAVRFERRAALKTGADAT
jgi:hypothetical protein